MKILLAGSARHMAVEWHYIRPFEEMGVEVHQYPAHDIVFNFHTRNIINKILFKTGLVTLYPKVNRSIIKLADKIKPDIIWIFKGMEFYPETIQQLSRNFKVINYNPDHPFEFSSRGSGNKNVLGSIPFFSLYLTYSEKIAGELEQRFKVTTAQLPFGYEYSPAVFKKAVAAEEINRCCFIGNPDAIRVEHIKALLEGGLPVDIYGHGWNSFFRSGAYPGLQVADAVYGDDFWVKARQYRVQLNVFRPHNEASHNMRSFEIPGIGGIQLAPYSPEHAHFFEDGKEIFLFRNTSEMVQKAKQLMAMPPGETNQIRESAITRSVQSEYSYKNRAAQLLEIFKKLCAERKG